VTVAGVGAEVTRAQQPRLPLLPDEVGEEYRRAFDAGATIGHIHGRRPDGSPTQDRETFRAYSEAIRARCPIVRQFSTGGAVGMGVEERIEALDLKPEMATLTLGTCNFGDDVFENSLPTIRTILERIRRYGVVPELEIFDDGMLATADFLFAKGLLTPPAHFDFVLGVPGAAAATPEN
jgi:3-keto-5-aminohexanoate cleavage enzyme